MSQSTLDDDAPAKSASGKPAAPAEGIDFVKLLSDPASIRDAIVVSEIFTRPEDRW